MRIRTLTVAAILLSCLIPLSADFYCKKYDVALDQWIRLEDGPKPILVQDVKFEFPSYIGPKKLDIKGVPQAVVNVKNYGENAMKIKIAIALFDAGDNLVGCGTAASGLGVTRAGKTEKLVVPFNNVRSKVLEAKYFILTVETE